MALDGDQLLKILEAALLVAGRPMNMNQIDNLFVHENKADRPARDEIRAALETLKSQYEDRGIELVEVASGFRIQARAEFAPWITNLFQEKAPRYSRALLETLVLIAYRQPITRGEVEDVRGVAVSTNIVKTLLEREWIKVLGHRDVPGRPAIYGTTRQFLDYFNLKRIDELPTLSEIKDLDQIAPDLAREIALLESVESEEGESPENQGESAENEVIPTEESADENDVITESDVENESIAESDDEIDATIEAADQVGEVPMTNDESIASSLDGDSELIDFDLGDETDDLHATGSHQPEQPHSDTVH